MEANDTGLSTSRFARAIARAPLVLSRHLWVWPLLGALLLGVTGFWVRQRVEGTTRAELGSELTTLLNADVAALRLWFSEQEADARSFAADVRIREAILELQGLPRQSNAEIAELAGSDAAQTLHRYLQPLLDAQHYLDYVVVGKDHRILASPRRYLVGRPAPRGYEYFVEKALTGQVAVSRPFAREPNAAQRAEGPTMFVAAPVNSSNGSPVAVLGLRMKPEEDFSRIFSVARMGQTGEAYAFDRRGVMLTASRFDAELKAAGLIPNQPEATSILNLYLADPGANFDNSRQVTNSFNPGGRREDRGRPRWPLTRMAASAIAGESGVDVDGYRNYRGRRVVGAWAWLPEYDMGAAAEVGADEAFQPLYMLRRVFLVLFLLLGLAALAIFAFTVAGERLQASARKSALAARHLGQYVLLDEIGRGANGMVYRARHTLLRRPVAVKLLDPDLTTDDTAERFEREVQITSQLTHPNTVAIYDYGRSPEGLFYYAMEFLDGIDLYRLVKQFGPQPEGRVIHILRQICGSLAEAHRNGLIHRDIKPANVFLTCRGGVCDVVKVLDFGLVKAVAGSRADGRRTARLEGTPHFMPPEAIEKPGSVDCRGDLYSLGAVGYWLLTGQTLFNAENVKLLLTKHLEETPPSPSARNGHACSAELEALIMRCLARQPEARPPSADAFREALSRCRPAQEWTPADADLWWRSNSIGREPAPEPALVEKTLVIAPRS